MQLGAPPTVATAPHGPPVAALHGRGAVVSVSNIQVARTLPRNFIGLSFEVSDLPLVARLAPRGKLTTMLRSLGRGVLRFGGVSADARTAWSPTGARPAWARSTFSRADLAAVGRLARSTGWRVLLTLGLGHPDPGLAASEARAARAELGRSLAGLELGNEPDAYVGKHLRKPGWSFAGYARDVAVYRRALARAAPRVPIVAPDASSGVAPLQWVRAAAETLHPALLTEHLYSSSSCGYTPVKRDLIATSTRVAERAMLDRLSKLSAVSRTPLQIDETNNVSCGGQPGVSDVFVSALWAVAYIAQAVDSRVTGLDFHSQLRLPHSYTPLAFVGGVSRRAARLRAAPEWYALLLGSMLRAGRPLRTRVSGDASLVATALRRRDGRLQLVLENLAAGPVVVHLHVGRRYGSGSILRLTAPSLAARGDVLLGGRRVSSTGRWSSPHRLPHVSGRVGRLAVQLAPYSAALVTLDRSR